MRVHNLTPYTVVSTTALEEEARFVAQLAATLGAAEVSSSPPEKLFDDKDHKRFVKIARYVLSEARRQVNEAAGVGPVPIYEVNKLSPDLGTDPS